MSIFNAAGSVAVVADVVGYYSDGTTSPGDRLTSSTPFRIVDTRNGQGDRSASPLGAGTSLSVTVAGANGIPSDADAVVLKVTATNTTAPSFLTLSPGGQARPLATNLNWAAGTTIPNQVVVKLGADGTVNLYNYSGSVDVVVDVMGWYRPASANPSGLQFFSVQPIRVLDTRDCDALGGLYGCPETMSAGSQFDVGVVGTGGVMPSAIAASLNATVTDTTDSSYLTVWPSGQSRPVASNLNWPSDSTIANLVLASVGSGLTGPDDVSVYNYAGQTDVVLDVDGYFQ